MFRKSVKYAHTSTDDLLNRLTDIIESHCAVLAINPREPSRSGLQMTPGRINPAADAQTA